MPYSPFWLDIMKSSSTCNKESACSSLTEAIIEAAKSNKIEFAFRQNKEVVDIHGIFRLLIWKGQPYVLKLLSVKQADKEKENATLANRRLAKSKQKVLLDCRVAIPKIIQIDDEISALVTEYYGHSLYEEYEAVGKSLNYYIEIFLSLLKEGIMWTGFLPRNIIPVNGKLIFIDWDDAVFQQKPINKICDLNLMKLTLGWAQIFPHSQNIMNKYCKTCREVTGFSDLDIFEKTYASIETYLNEIGIRDCCNRITLFTEIPDAPILNKKLTPMEIGHLIDELLDPYISVLYSFGSNHLKKKLGKDGFKIFIDAIAHVFQMELIYSGAKDYIKFDLIKLKQQLVLVLLACFESEDVNLFQGITKAEGRDDINDLLVHNVSISKFFIKYGQLRDRKGLSNAIERARVIDGFIQPLFCMLLTIFPQDHELDLLLRGSLGQGIVTINSDIDFEISGEFYREGHRGIEKLMGSIFDVFEIPWQGSADRPVEEDIVSKRYGLSRDLHEWFELRRPGFNRSCRGWLENEFSISDVEIARKSSKYENSGNPLTAKFVFFEIRATIARIAFLNGLQIACTKNQCEGLKDKIGEKMYKEIKSILELSLKYYENDFDTKCDLNKLHTRIEIIRSIYSMPQIKII